MRIKYEHDGNEWSWQVEGSDYCYYTDKRGDGVFVRDLKTGNTKQIVGTCQFSVAGLKDPRAKIRRWMNEDDADLDASRKKYESIVRALKDFRERTKKKIKYIVKVWSNSTHEREYKTYSKSAMKAAEKYGRYEGGEVVQVCNKSGKVLSEVRYTQEDGGKYYRVVTDDDYARLGKW